MPCCLAILALAAPRVVIVLLVIFSDYIGRAYEGVLVPLLGFIFLPLTTLAYAFAIHSAGSVRGIYLVLVVIAVLIDLSSNGYGLTRKRGAAAV